MFSRVLSKLKPTSNRFGIGHIKDMNEQNQKVRDQEKFDSHKKIETTQRVYKPSYTIEFNREGEVLLFSGTPINSSTMYFKYPYIFYESFIPLAFLNYVLNPFDLVWYWGSFFLYFTPWVVQGRIWYFRDFMWRPNRLFLLRGESQTIGNTRYVYWAENFMCKPVTEDRKQFDNRDEADFLSEQGQLKYDLFVELEHCKFQGVNYNDIQLHFIKENSTIHHPQIFEAAMKGYNIDTSDFVINTADNIRYRESKLDE